MIFNMVIISGGRCSAIPMELLLQFALMEPNIAAREMGGSATTSPTGATVKLMRVETGSRSQRMV